MPTCHRGWARAIDPPEEDKEAERHPLASTSTHSGSNSEAVHLRFQRRHRTAHVAKMPWNIAELAAENKVELTGPMLMTLSSTWAGSLCVGTTIGYTTAALTSLTSGTTDHKFDTEEHGVWFVTLLHVGATTGCVIAALVGQSMGRRFALLASALGYFAGYGIISVARNDYLVLFGRFLTGVATGMVSLCSPSFLAEITVPEQRGTAGGILQVCLTLGILYANVMGRYLNWDGLAFLSMAASIPLVATCQFAVESPRWLLLQGRKTEAIEVLGKLRGPAAKLDREWADMETVYAKVPTPTAHILGAMQVHFVQQFSGINPVLFFSHSVFDQAGLALRVQDTSVILSGFLVASTATAVKLMSVFSRKRLLTVSAYTCAFSMMILATLYQVGVEVDEADPNAPIGIARRLPIVFIALYIIGFSVGLGPITWLISAELVPMRNNGVFSALVAAFSWICAFLVTWFFERLHETLELSGVGLLFSALTFTGGLMMSFFMPETQDKTLEELLLEPHRKTRDDAASTSSKGSGGSRRSKR
ncbi:trehalose transporter 1-like protein [Dermacentor andersoni]|uniref:trehalose transporter 1-like protein n=2 Tax=Dermacentor andersoni TaxID=34620 RepID=UPI003B3A501B